MTNILIKLFVKDYKNTTNAKVRQQYGKFASVVGVVTNLILFAIKIAVGIVFNSIAITADAINNLSDSSSSFITLIGFKISGKPADKEHPYGHARMEYISGLIVSFLICFLGFQLFQNAFDKILHPQEAKFSTISIGVLIVAIFGKLWQYLFYKKIATLIDSTTLIATSIDSRNDILSTAVVLLGIIITYYTGFNLDGYLGLVVAILIIISGIKLIMDTVSPLLGTAPSEELVEYIYQKILSYDGIVSLHDLQVHSYGEGQIFATVHCEVPAEEDIMVSHDIIDNIERYFMKEEGINLVIHLDPIITSDEKTNKLREKVIKTISNISKELSLHDFRVVWGVSHSNLIFDVVVPYSFEYSNEELIEIIDDKVKEIDPCYNCVVTIDHDYIPNY
ncbi:cation diffusion facilitator family transporter [Alkalibaculum bacchi]|uniref:Cation diffusion facilitator family transporter n=1 Tax=Alkalibaculum bacchi TaxID=645887 RepID=A0A366I8V6_9FIRM|nr:cation diffusion facilitator family transporter [Alkalibaculum bacchi]RBP65967.1 cation diffusion facilitator family transporter [Alkalibaculum bacchi]